MNRVGNKSLLDAKNEVEINELMSMWRQRLRKMASNSLGSIVSSRVDTSDVAQEGMIQLWNDFDRFRGTSPEQMEAWVRRIGSGHAAKLRRMHLASKRSAILEKQTPHEHESESDDPSQQVEKRETNQQLIAAIQTLNEIEQTVLNLRVFEDQSFVEIANRIGGSARSARATFARIIKQLHKVLAKHTI